MLDASGAVRPVDLWWLREDCSEAVVRYSATKMKLLRRLLRRLVGIALIALVSALVAAAAGVDVPWPFPAPVFYGVLLIVFAAFAYGRIHKPPPIQGWRDLVLVVLAGLGAIGLACLLELWGGLTGGEILKTLTFTFPTGKHIRIYTAPGCLLIGYISLGYGAIELIRNATIPRVR
jgi:hypothetical protein